MTTFELFPWGVKAKISPSKSGNKQQKKKSFTIYAKSLMTLGRKIRLLINILNYKKSV